MSDEDKPISDKYNKMTYDDLRYHLRADLESFIDEAYYEVKPSRSSSSILAIKKTNYEKLIDHLEAALEKAHALHVMDEGKKAFESDWKETRRILKEFV